MSPDERYAVQLVTFGQGDAVHQYFGHNAMNVIDRGTGTQRLYNFGMFGFGPSMLPQFLSGRLRFWTAITDTEATLASYRRANRSIEVRDLQLPWPAKLRVLRGLDSAVSPEHRYYLYDHYTANCSTKLRDLLDTALDGKFRQANSGPARYTLRGHTRRYVQHDSLINLLLLFAMNDEMERPIRVWDEMYLPDELGERLDHFELPDQTGALQPIVARRTLVFAADRAAVLPAPTPLWPRTLLIGSALGALALCLALRLRRAGGSWARWLFALEHVIVGLVFGLAGSILLALSTLTEHHVTYHNENLLLANPLMLLSVAGLGIVFRSERCMAIARWGWYLAAVGAVLAIIAKVLPAFDQRNLEIILLIAPISFGFAAGHSKLHQPAAADVSARVARSAGPAKNQSV